MKNILYTIVCVVFSANAAAQIYFNENFEKGIPSNWTQEFDGNNIQDINWSIENGGYADPYQLPLRHFPSAAKSGLNNAIFHLTGNDDKNRTKLITNAINLEAAKKPELTFWHAQDEWDGDYERLRVYCKPHVDSSWMLLEEYLDIVSDWKLQSIFLPDSLLSNTFFIAFEGETNFGYGACIDSIEIIERGIIPMHLLNYDVQQANNGFAVSNAENVPILRIEFNVFGNAGKLILDSLNINFSGTDTSAVDDSGVRLFYTERPYFSPQNLVGSAKSFVSSNASFSNLNHELPFGKTYLWVTYNSSVAANNGDILDGTLTANSVIAQLDTSNINFNESVYSLGDSVFYIVENDTASVPINYVFPSSDINPLGHCYLKDAILYDDFETDTFWAKLLGDFEINTPLGLGGTWGGADPINAFSGTQVLGTDLTDDGDYIDNSAAFLDSYFAETKPINAYYYKDLELGFQLWLNKDNFDPNFKLQMSSDSGATWFTIKNYSGNITQDYWSFQDFNLAYDTLDRLKNILLRVNAGPTDVDKISSGWNIDDFALGGDYIANDISVSKLLTPDNGCGHSISDSVTVMVKNHGPTVSKDTIPIFYSFYGGDSIVYDTIFNANLAPEDSMLFTFTKRIDLSKSGAYDVLVATDLPSDEYRINDTIYKSLYIQPTLDLPYAESFEINQGLWLTGGNENNTWEWGNPTGGAKDGLKAWVTKLAGNYKNLDSSWIESVCFNFDDTLPKIIDFYHKAYLQEGIDGALLEYSLDNGQIWNYVDTHNYTYDWNWYNDTILSFGGEKGWSKSYTNWTRERQVLPDILDEETQVKFRIHFDSDSTINNAGIFIDNFKIYKAPYDIGIVSIDSVESACQFVNTEQVSVTIKNFGIRDMQPGDTILVGVDASRNNSMVDTLVLQGVLAANDSVVLKLNKSINLDTAGMYDMTAYTLIEEDPFFYSETCNDTASLTFHVHPNPVTNLADTIKTARPDTLTVKAYYDPLYQYSWLPAGGANDSVYHVATAGDIFLTITNSDSTACVTNDTINIHQLVPDLSVDSIMNPISSCELDTAETVTIRIRNIGSDTLNIGDTIVLGYSFDAGLPVVDTFLMPTRFHPGDTMDFHIDKDSLDMSVFSTYSIKAYLDFAWDFVPDNDTLEASVTTWGYPSVDLGSDTTIYTLEHVIDAGAGYSSYLWNTGDTTRYDTVTAIGDYHVIITDEHGCPNSDTVHVNFDYLDIGVSALVEPFDQCMPSDTLEIIATITNTGTDTITNNTALQFGYTINGGTVYTDNYVLNQDIYPDSSFQFIFTDKQFFDTPGDYLLDVFTLIPGDINTANDTLSDTLSFYPYPVLELGADTFVKAYEYTLDAGYDSTNTYLWNTGADTSAITITTPGDYSVTVTSSHGCFSTDERRVTIVVPDITVMNLINPDTSCIPKSPVKMKATLYNNGTDTAYAGETITMGYSVNGGDLTTEPYTLLTNFLPNAVLVYEFTNAYEFTNDGNTEIAIFALADDDINTANDTLTETIVFYPYPEVELGNDTTVKSYEFVLDAGYDASYSYEWNTTGEDTSSITITNGGTYSVSVTSGEGCLTTDERTVMMKVPDIEISQLIYPVTACIPEGTINIKFNVHNNGNDTLFNGSTIKLGYQIDAFAPVEIDYVLTEDLLPDANLEYQFNKNELFASGSWEISSYVVMSGDINTSNDTIVNTFSFYDYPVVELGNDTLIKAANYTLVAHNDPTYTYDWSDGSEDSTLIVSSNGTYHVTVTTAHGCSTEDEITLLFTYPDIRASKITEPSNFCAEDDKLVAVNIINEGSDTLEIGNNIQVGYKVGDGTFINEQLTLSERFLPDDTINYSFNNLLDMSQSGPYQFKIFAGYDDDLILDDTLTHTISILEPPVVSFEEEVNDTIKKELPISIKLENASEYASYIWSNGLKLPRITVNDPGWYSVSVTDNNGCPGEGKVYVEEDTAVVCDTCGTYVDQLFNEQLSLNIYPNPADEVLFIDFDAKEPGRVILQLFNSQGKAVLNKQTDIIRQYKETVNTVELPNGIYILRVIYNDKSRSYRIVKQ